MTSESGELSAVQLCRARNTLRRDVGTLLAGSGLKIRELANGLVITNPADRDKGQIHVAYADSYVSWSRTVWDYLGNLQGYEDDPGDTGSGVGAEQILAALTGGQEARNSATE